MLNKENLNIIIKTLISVWLLVKNMCCYKIVKKIKNFRRTGMIYIVIWTKSDTEPFGFWSRGNHELILMNCKFQNCYLTDNKKYFPDPKEYDALLFNAADIHASSKPWRRSDNQIYVFVSTESESNYALKENYDNFFNYTWTYKLNSDIPMPYFYVRNKFNGKVIGPNKIVHWVDNKKMKPTPKSVMKHLQNKNTCAAWFVSNCNANNERLNFVRALRKELRKLGHQLDVFGACEANQKCQRDYHKNDNCFDLVKDRYFFYLSFENSFSEDYVTEKLLNAVNNYAVPVVFGGANYSRFLPDGAYLNAREYTPVILAMKMNDIIKHKEKYYNFFKFHRYYTYHEVGESEDINPLCRFCKFLNNNVLRTIRRTYSEFSKWWHSNSMTKHFDHIKLNDDHTIKAATITRRWDISPTETNNMFSIKS